MEFGGDDSGRVGSSPMGLWTGSGLWPVGLSAYAWCGLEGWRLPFDTLGAGGVHGDGQRGEGGIDAREGGVQGTGAASYLGQPPNLA